MRARPLSSLFSLSLSALFLGISTSGAHAYLDPGTGSMILQVLLGGIAGLLVVGKLYWHKLLTMLRVRSGSDAREESIRPAATDGQDDR